LRSPARALDDHPDLAHDAAGMKLGLDRPADASSHTSSKTWLPPTLITILAGIGFALTALVLIIPRYLPFQDLPNHALVLALARALRKSGPTTYLELPDFRVWGYSLYVGIDRVLARALSADATARIMIVAAALALPIAVSRLATRLGGRASVALALALPIALCWPVRMGFVPYIIGLAFLLALAVALVDLLSDLPAQRLRRSFLFVLAFALLCYLSHALVFVIALGLVGIGWLTMGRWRWRRLVLLTLALAPALILMTVDVSNSAFEQIPNTQMVWWRSKKKSIYRPAKLALTHVVTRSYGVTGPGVLPYYLPLMIAVVGLAGVGTVAAFRRRRVAEEDPRGVTTTATRRAWLFVLSAGIVASVGTVAVPETVGLAFLTGQRIPIIGFALLTAAAGAMASRLATPLCLAALSTVVLAQSSAGSEIVHRARQVETILGAGDLHSVSGPFMTARINDCPMPAATWTWGNYHSEWHLWAYALSDRSVTPYLFAYARYLPIWFRADTFHELGAPQDAASNSPWMALPQSYCAEYNRRRVLRVLNAPPAFSGIVMFGSPGSVGDLLDHLTVPSGHFKRIAKGMAVYFRDGQ